MNKITNCIVWCDNVGSLEKVEWGRTAMSADVGLDLAEALFTGIEVRRVSWKVLDPNT